MIRLPASRLGSLSQIITGMCSMATRRLRSVVVFVLFLFTTHIHAIPEYNAATIIGIGNGISDDLALETSYFVQLNYKAHKQINHWLQSGSHLICVLDTNRSVVVVFGFVYSDMVTPEET